MDIYFQQLHWSLTYRTTMTYTYPPLTLILKLYDSYWQESAIIEESAWNVWNNEYGKGWFAWEQFHWAWQTNG